MPVNTQYAKEIHDQFGYLATWLPTASISVGDVGTVEGGIFTKKGALNDFEIDFKEQISDKEASFEYSSAGAVDIKFSVAADAPIPGTVPAKADGDITVSFKHASAILFQTSQHKTAVISNIGQVTDKIVSLFAAGKWPKNQVVITDVVYSAATTVLISSGSDAHITLRVKGDLGAEKLKLANAKANFDVQSSSSIGTSIISKAGLTPLFIARGIKTPLLPWNAPSLDPRDGTANATTLLPLDYQQLQEVGPDGDRAG